MYNILEDIIWQKSLTDCFPLKQTLDSLLLRGIQNAELCNTLDPILMMRIQQGTPIGRIELALAKGRYEFLMV